MNLLPEIENRVSVRNFSDKQIDKDVLERILEAGRLAPSAKNRQPWRFIVIQNKEIKDKIQNIAYGEEYVGQAPVVIAACSTNIDYRMPNGQLSYPIDISMATSFMMVQAQNEGLGSCVNTTFDEVELKELLTIPYSMRIVMLLVLGYPAEEGSTHKVRKPFNRVIAYEHW